MPIPDPRELQAQGVEHEQMQHAYLYEIATNLERIADQLEQMD